jgi:hypothetical protein
MQRDGMGVGGIDDISMRRLASLTIIVRTEGRATQDPHTTT